MLTSCTSPHARDAFHAVLLACFMRRHMLSLTMFANVRNGSKAELSH
jgi:hypothetical protein